MKSGLHKPHQFSCRACVIQIPSVPSRAQRARHRNSWLWIFVSRAFVLILSRALRLLPSSRA